jgi:hypothetical protein
MPEASTRVRALLGTGLESEGANRSNHLVQSAVNKAKGMVLNLSEIEIKVREATNDDAW